MDRTTLEAIGLAAAVIGAVTLGLAWLQSRRRAARLEAAVVRAETAGAAGTRSAAELHRALEAATSGEREAAWAARRLAGAVAQRDARLAATSEDLREATLAAAASERQLDDLREQLRRLDTELADSARRGDAAATRLAEIETELVAAAGEINRLRAAVDRVEAGPPATPAGDGRLEAALAEAARLGEIVRTLEASLEAERRRAPGGIRPAPDERDAALARLAAEAESSGRVAAAARAEVERLTVELNRVRTEADLRVAAALAGIREPAAAPPEPNALLLVREAEIRDLEERLTVLSAARNAELRRLNERIAGLERLYLEIEGRDRRIAELELELKDATETLETVRTEAGVLDLRLAEAERELAAARQAVAAATELHERLAASQHRLEELETAVVRSRSSSGEVEQLRAMLSAERERNVRLVRRATLEPRPEFGAILEAATRPLQDTIARLEHELSTRSAPPVPPLTDDVTLIRGIGPKIAALLARHGITSLRQIAAFTAEDIARIRPLLPVYPGRIDDDRWIEQARQLLAGTEGAASVG